MPPRTRPNRVPEGPCGNTRESAPTARASTIPWMSALRPPLRIRRHFVEALAKSEAGYAESLD